jgi:hypothetical protein
LSETSAHALFRAFLFILSSNIRRSLTHWYPSLRLNQSQHLVQQTGIETRNLRPRSMAFQRPHPWATCDV